MAQKLENFRKMSQSISAQDDFDVDDDEYTPHFQRVYITGEDNTGVSKNCKINALGNFFYIKCF